MTTLPSQSAWFDELFRTIDNAAWKDFARFFHTDIVYERPGYPPIEGIEALLDFYSNTRIIAEGKHSLDGRLHGDGKAICWGQFSGRSKSGDLLNERFADAYELEDGVIKRRITYFFRAAI
ncbi:MAG TPA: nuclear transport factor 2 family protein [Tahibacter sp.]|nr:nuclear transport factor 2 family protein [Tahibacter sp.]